MKKGRTAKEERRAVLRVCLSRVRLEVASAASLAKSMQRRLREGDIDSAFQAALDIEPHLHHGVDVIQTAGLYARPIRES